MKNRALPSSRRLPRAVPLLVVASLLSAVAPTPASRANAAHRADASDVSASEPLVVVVRHAEKAGSHGNVDLSPAGIERAAALPAAVRDLAAGREVRAVVVTETCRAAQTAAPTARALGLPLSVQPVSGGGLDGCDPSVDDLEKRPLDVALSDGAALAAAVAGLTGDHGAVLVVGHSNTVPGLVAELTGVALCPAPFPFDDQGRCWLPDGDYQHLFVLRRGADGWRAAPTTYGAGGEPSASTVPDADRDVAAAQRLQAEARAAYRDGDLAAFTDLMEQALAANPASQATRYNLACGYARSGRDDEAMRLLAGLAAARIDFGMADDPDLASLHERPDFQALVARLESDLAPVAASSEVRRFEQLGLLPEGIAFDAASGRTFFGSMRTGEVYAVAADGTLSRFAELRHAGRRLAAVGMTVDAERDLLWVAGAVFAMMEGFDPAEPGLGGVFAFDLASGEERRHHVAQGDGAGFNDLVVTADGTVYATGDGLSRVAADAAPGSTPEHLAFTSELVGANGITATPDGGVLYVSVYPVGIARVEPTAGTWAWLGEPPDAPLIGIDGLYWHRGGLVGIQNGLRPWRLVALTLDDAGKAVTAARWIESALQDLAPTTGALLGDEILYVAQGPSPEAAPSQFPPLLARQLGPVVILRAPLE